MQSQLPADPQATDLLFVEDDMIYSVLDLTQELMARGIITIYNLSNGSTAYRIILDQERPYARRPIQPKGEIVKRVRAIFHRKHSTLWSAEEVKAFKALTIDPDDLAIVEEYYKSEAGKENSYCRTTLLTFLRHYLRRSGPRTALETKFHQEALLLKCLCPPELSTSFKLPIQKERGIRRSWSWRWSSWATASPRARSR